MGWFDLFKFNFHTEKIGPHDIPRDVHDDLLNNKQSFNSRKQNDRSHATHNHHDEETNISDEFERMFQQFDIAFKNFFNEPNDVARTEGGNTLREKMLDNNKDQNMFVVPFEDDFLSNQQGDDIRSLPPSMFHGLFNFPFKDLMKDLYQLNIDHDFNDGVARDAHLLDDIDLDADINKGTQSLDDILNNSNENDHNNNKRGLMPKKHQYSFYSTTVTKKINPDGSIETRRIKRDADGNEEVFFTQSFGNDYKEQDVLNDDQPTGIHEWISSWWNPTKINK